MFLFSRRGPIEGWALIGFCAAGLFWGYLAGACATSISCSPGGTPTRSTPLWRSPAAPGSTSSAGGFAPARRGVDHLDRWVMAGLPCVRSMLRPCSVIPGSRASTVRSSRLMSIVVCGGRRAVSVEPPSPRLLWVVERVKRHVQPGERLLYEEGGFGLPGVPDPFQGGRFSGLLPERHGVEVIGGPYLHASLTDQLHPVRRRKALRQRELGPCLFRALRQTLPSVGYIVLEPACASLLSGESRPGEGARG